MSAERFIAYRRDGELHDDGLHDEILAGEHSTETTRDWLKGEGWSEEDIAALGLGEGTATTDEDEEEGSFLDPDLREIARGAPSNIVQYLWEEQERRNAGRPEMQIDRAIRSKDWSLVEELGKRLRLPRGKRTGRRIHLHF